MKPLHWSQLRHMARSPAHYKYALDRGVTPTAAMKLGSLAHSMVLGVVRSFVVFEGTRRGKVWDQFESEHAGVEIVTAAEWQRASDIAFAVKSNPNAATLLRGLREHHLQFEIAGRECAGTVDVCGDGLADLKITHDASPDRFPWHALRMGWPAQMAWYDEGATQMGKRPMSISLIAVEAKPPHVVQVYDLSEGAVEMGRKHYRLLLERLLVCERADTWPGYCESVLPLDAPEDCALVIDGEEVTL